MSNEMNSIHAIETIYNGYRFRSRLEARWAVFFDAVGIKYQYEPEGYEINQVRYLPDFYLPELDTFVEVKANKKEAIKDVERCASMIQWGGPIKRIVFLSDIPGECKDGGEWHFPAFYWQDNEVQAGWYLFLATGNENMPTTGFISRATYMHPFVWNNGHIEFNRDLSLAPISSTVLEKRRDYAIHRYFEDKAKFNLQDFKDISMRKSVFSGFMKARQARFEYGETPDKSKDDDEYPILLFTKEEVMQHEALPYHIS